MAECLRDALVVIGLAGPGAALIWFVLFHGSRRPRESQIGVQHGTPSPDYNPPPMAVASRAARTDHRLPPHTGGYRPQPPSRDLTERPTPPAGPGGGSPSPDVLAALRRANEAAKRDGWKADIGVDDVDLLLDLAEQRNPPGQYLHPDDGHTLECAARLHSEWVCAPTCPNYTPVMPGATDE